MNREEIDKRIKLMGTTVKDVVTAGKIKEIIKQVKTKDSDLQDGVVKIILDNIISMIDIPNFREDFGGHNDKEWNVIVERVRTSNAEALDSSALWAQERDQEDRAFEFIKTFE